MKNNKQGGVKAPRKHDPRYPDRTSTARGNKRTLSLNQKAQAKGWDGISEYLTAIINGEIEIAKKN